MKTRKLLAGIMALALVCAVPVNLSPAVKDFSITAHAIAKGTEIIAGNLNCEVLSTDRDGTVNLEVNGFSDEVGDAETLEFPEVVDGIPVRYVSIGAEAFTGSSLTEVILPDTIEHIYNKTWFDGKGAFANCTSLKKVHLPEGGNFHYINNRTFSGCSALEEINIPDSVNEIGADAFAETSLLTAQENEPIKYIGNWAISCENDVPLEFKEGTVGIADACAQGNKTSILTFPSSLRYIGNSSFMAATGIDTIIIPDGVEIVHAWAFGSMVDGLKEVIFSGTVGTIESFAFSSDHDLTSVQFNETIGSIESRAFGDCDGLTSVQFNGSVEHFVENVFADCTSLSEIVLPEGTTEISKEMFSNCTSLTSVTIPDSVTTIAAGAFKDCTSLTSIIIPDSVTTIGGSDNSSYTSDKYGAFENCTSLESIKISDNLINIGVNTFSKCTNLISITIPDSVTGIESGAFSQCANLASITIENPNCKIYDGSYTISNGYDDDNNHFYYNGTIYGYKDSTAQSYAKKYKYNFESLGTAPKQPTSGICGANATWNFDTETGTLTISGTGEMWGYYGYAPWHGLDIQEVIIENGITTISNKNFSNCASLTSVTIPESVTYIGICAFAYCENLTSITITNPNCEIHDYRNTISNNLYYFDGTIYGYPDSTAQEYAEKYGYTFALIGTEPADPPTETTSITEETTTTTEEITTKATTTSSTVLETTTKETTSNTEESTTAETTTSAEETATSSTVLETTTEEETSAIEETTTEEVTTSTAPETTETSSTVLETTTEETTTTQAPYASDKDFCDWAVKDYKQKTDTKPAKASSETDNGKTVITLLDENGEILDTYTIDPVTGKGTTSNGAEVNLPQTGITSKATASTAVAAIAVTAAGIALMGIARKRDED